jgi:hypothetical protein
MPGAGLEPARGKPPQDFKSCVSASSTTPAYNRINNLVLPHAAVYADCNRFCNRRGYSRRSVHLGGSAQ